MSFVFEDKKVYSINSPSLIEIIQAVIGKQKSLRFRVNGFSMSPFIRDGDVVTLFPINNCSIDIGRVVAFIHPCAKKLVIHRVLAKCPCGTRYVIKGDNTQEIDGFIQRQDILGYVRKVKRGRRNIYLGLGPERRLVAYLSRINFWRKLFFFGNLIPLSLKERIKKIV